jgi:hypothetical protein
MRRLIKSAISAIVTFTIGVLVSIAWSHAFPQRVSLCVLAQNPAAYDRKLITIEAFGSVTSSPIFEENYVIIFEPRCAEPDAWASIQLHPTEKRNPEVEEFINAATPEIREAKLVVEGQFDQWASLGCFSPRFGIKAATIKLLSPVATKPLPKMPQRDSL